MPQGSSTSVKVFYPSFKIEELLLLLKERIKGLQALLPLKKVMLFGSWSTGRETAFSDIDLLVIYEGQGRQEAYKIVWRYLNLRGLEAHRNRPLRLDDRREAHRCGPGCSRRYRGCFQKTTP